MFVANFINRFPDGEEQYKDRLMKILKDLLALLEDIQIPSIL
jgi:hypothetical protein